MAVAAALTVSFTVCEASCPGLSRSLQTLSPLLRLASFKMDRAEQKAPYDLNIIRGCETSSERTFARTESMLSGGATLAGGENLRLYGPSPFSRRGETDESPRAPPLMDPPHLS
jgi:hypothetical protein